MPFGATVWATGYVVLPEAGLYQPIWKYDAKTLAWDLSAHLACGAGTGTTFWLLTKIIDRTGHCACLITSGVTQRNKKTTGHGNTHLGIGELILPANEPGSSILPDKVNPTSARPW